MQIITVTQLNTYIKSYIDSNPIFSGLFVRGEISNFKRHSSGHCYMTLKDEGSAIRAVMFRSAAYNLKFEPENGMKVIAEARLSVYERDGQYQLYINELQPDGLGALSIRFNQLKEKLEAEGIFSSEHKKPIPKIPMKIGVVTSKTGAAVRDILNVLKRRRPDADIYLCPAVVQGAEGADSIVSALKKLNELPLDVIILARGGGSIEDLWCFNEECVAREVYASEIPVISGVGHETDFTLADFAADLRAPTPSAAAELASLSREELLGYPESIRLRLINAVRTNLKNKTVKFELLKSNYFLTNPERIIENKILRCEEDIKKLKEAYRKKLDASGHRAALLASKLDSLSPLKVLAKGYAFVENQDNKIISSKKQLNSKDKIKLTFSDGTVDCEVI